MRPPRKREQADAGHADPFDRNALAKAQSTYAETESSATVTKFPFSWKALRSRAAVRLAELVRLAHGRRKFGLIVDPHLFAWTIAATLGSVAAGPYKVARRQRFIRWHGLELESLKHAIGKAEIGSFAEAELCQIIEDIERGHIAHGVGLMSAVKAGRLLQVTAAEREEFTLRTIEACDEPREARIARQAEERKKRDAERKRADRGCTPWPVYQANSLSNLRPWEDEGICRRTWERRRQRVANVPAHVLESQGSRTRLRQEVPPHLIQRGTGSSNLIRVGQSRGADGPSPVSSWKADAASRSDGDAAAEGEEVAGSGASTSFPARVLRLAQEAHALVQDEPETELGLRMCCSVIRIDFEAGSDTIEGDAAVVAAEMQRVLRPRAANDNRIADVLSRLAA